MRLNEEHINNLQFLLEGVPDNQIQHQLAGHAKTWSQWKISDSGKPAYPGLQTASGRVSYADKKREMWDAINNNNVTSIEGTLPDDLCQSNICGNFTGNGCRLEGKNIKRR